MNKKQQAKNNQESPMITAVSPVIDVVDGIVYVGPGNWHIEGDQVVIMLPIGTETTASD